MEKSGDPGHNLTPTSENTPSSGETPRPKIKYDWYQSDSHVTITVLAKNCKPDDVKVNFTDHRFVLDAKLADGSDYNLQLDLLHAIVPDRSNFKVLPSKIEVRLAKASGDRWSGLEGEPRMVVPQPRNWDAVVGNLLKDDDAEGEAALNALFQKIYADGSDEVKKAMNKSYMESGGTVLSTNWNEVAKDKVDVKPPDGTEFRKWE